MAYVPPEFADRTLSRQDAFNGRSQTHMAAPRCTAMFGGGVAYPIVDATSRSHVQLPQQQARLIDHFAWGSSAVDGGNAQLFFTQIARVGPTK